jgi:hypothetical protein
VAEGTRPWNYLRLKLNCFDLFIVVVCFVSLEDPGEQSSGEPSSSMIVQIRLLRLLRLFRLVTQLEGLSIMAAGLAAGSVSIM